MTDLSPDTRALLEVARAGDDPSESDRQRVKRALAASVAAGLALGSLPAKAAASLPAGTAAVATTGGAAKVGLWLSIGLAAGLATSGTVVALSHTGPAPLPAVAERPDRATRAAAEIAVPPPTTVAAPAAVEAPATRAAASAGVPSTGARVETGRAPASTLAAETALLEGARAALGRGDSEAALRALSEHAQRFPQGALVEERLASQVFAFCGLGRRADAARAAAELLRRAPASPLRGRVQASCAGDH
jgi:hypothetical protein